jgi:hypothetical protein
MPASPQSPATPKPKAERGPNAAHLLLKSIRNAVEAGVPASTISAMIDMALGAEGAQQAPGWKMVSGALNNATAAAKPATPAEKPSA